MKQEPATVDAASAETLRIRDWIVGLLTGEYGLEPELVERAHELSDLGLDSVETLSMQRAIEAWLGRSLPATLFLEAGSLDALCRRLAGEDAPAVARAPRSDLHPYAAFVNPHLGEQLAALNLDKSYVRGEGCVLTDARGERYLDFVAGFGALPFGFNPPEIWAAVRATEAACEANMVYPSNLEAAGQLAERLVEIAPGGLDTVTFTNSGAEAVEAAIKLCRAATGRRGVLSTYRGFHGKTLGALSATENAKYQRPFGAPLPGFDKVPFGDADALRAAIAARPGAHAAFIVEPIQGEAGAVEPPPGYLAEAAEICRAAGVLVVADEVQTGLGRTGALFASSEEGLEPDVLTLAKALGGGLVPIGACLARRAVYDEEFGMRHSSTFAGNTLACRVGLAALERLTADGGALLRHVRTCGDRLRRGLDDLARRYPQVLAGAQGRGFLLGLRFAVDRESWPASLIGLAAEQETLPALVSSYLLNVEHMRLAPTVNGSDVLRIEPALVATWDHCQKLLDALDRTVAVLDTRDTGSVLAGMYEKPVRPPQRARVRRGPEVRPRDGDARFGFLVHPGSYSDLTYFDESLESLAPGELDEIGRRWGGFLDPFVLNATRIESPTGAGAYGEFVMVGRCADELVELPHADALAEIRAAAELARGSGAELIGLGGYTSIASACGEALAGLGVPLTTGNSYTVVSGNEALALALRQLGRVAAESALCVVGATGAIGRGLAILASERFGRLALIGNPGRPPAHSRRRLVAVAADVCRHLVREARRGRRFADGSFAAELLRRGPLPPEDASIARYVRLIRSLEDEAGTLTLSCDADAVLPSADVVVTATSTTDVLVTAENLKLGAVVCELSRPRNTSAKIRDQRPDALVIDGGVVEAPGRPWIGWFGLQTGFMYACMAETAMLALEREGRSRSLGSDLALADILHLRSLAERHEFSVSELTSFDRPLSEEDWRRVRQAGAARVVSDPPPAPSG